MHNVQANDPHDFMADPSLGDAIYTQEMSEQIKADPENEADFDRAYNKLVNKYYNEHGNNMLIPEEDMHMAHAPKLNVN